MFPLEWRLVVIVLDEFIKGMSVEREENLGLTPGHCSLMRSGRGTRANSRDYRAALRKDDLESMASRTQLKFFFHRGGSDFKCC